MYIQGWANTGSSCLHGKGHAGYDCGSSFTNSVLHVLTTVRPVLPTPVRGDEPAGTGALCGEGVGGSG